MPPELTEEELQKLLEDTWDKVHAQTLDEARNNPTFHADGSSSQDFLPLEEQWDYINGFKKKPRAAASRSKKPSPDVP